MGSKTKQFFNDWPESYRLFKTINSYINSLGEIKTDVMKTQISFGAKRKFAWVWLPQTWINKRPSESLTITFVLNQKLEDKQIESVVEPRPGIWTHHVVIRDTKDFSDKVRNWIKQAHEQSL